MEDLGAMVAINILNPTTIIQALVGAKERIGSPFHLVTIASRAAWKAWPDQTVYCGSKAYQAQFSRALARELERDLQGSKVTIVMPGGIKTKIFSRTSIDPSRFMDPEVVAGMIWQEVLSQQGVCDWFNILQQDGQPTISRDSFVPELAYEQLPRRQM
jgi:short-subunit dehydrogenase